MRIMTKHIKDPYLIIKDLISIQLTNCVALSTNFNLLKYERKFKIDKYNRND